MKIFDENKNGLVYGLVDSGKPELVRYVGITTLSLKRRLQMHRYDNDKNKRTNWIKNVTRSGREVLIIELDNGNVLDIIEKEKQYIKLFLSVGARLVNMNLGGIGCLGYKWTKEQIESRKKNYHNPLKGKSYEEYFGETRAVELKGKVGKLGRKILNRKKRLPFTENELKKHSEVRMNKFCHSKHKVGKYDLDMNLLEVYESTVHAARMNNTTKGQVYNSCRGFYFRKYNGVRTRIESKSAKGFIYKYLPVFNPVNN